MKPKTEFLCAFGFTILALGLCALASVLFTGCSMAEWQDIFDDAATQAPGVIIDTATKGGTEAPSVPESYDLTNAAISFVSGLAAGWYGRKFKDRKYVKAAKGNGTAPLAKPGNPVQK